MKKIFFCFILLFCTLLSAYAVPAGTYLDNRGRAKALVTNDGTIYIFDRDGSVVNTELKVIDENNDGSFVTKVVAIKGNRYDGPTYYQNAYFVENGQICLNLQNVMNLWGTLTRED